MYLSNYSGRNFLLEIFRDKVLLDGEVVATIKDTPMGEEFKECLRKECDKVWQKQTK